MQSSRARQSSALAAFGTCLRSFQHTYAVELDTIAQWADRRQACVSAHLDHRSQIPSWQHEGGMQSQILAAVDRDRAEDVDTGKHQERGGLGGALDGGKQRSRRKG